MFVERCMYLEVTSQSTGILGNKSLKVKFFLHLGLVLTIHGLVFWYFPMNSNFLKSGSYYCNEKYNLYKCNNFEINIPLEFFYFFYMIYFVFSSSQIKYGAPKTRAGEFVLMKSYNTISNILFMVYRGFPFLFEIRTLIDWTFTATSLTLMQWFKFEEIYAVLYNTKCDQTDFSEHKRGEKLGKFDKTLKGCCFLILILLCVLAPLIIFSSLNPFIYSNPIKSMQVSVGISTGDNNFYSLSTITIVQSRDQVSLDEWNKNKFGTINQLSTNDRSLMDKIILSSYPNTNWLASENNIKALCNSLLQSNVELEVQYNFYRSYPSTQQTVTAQQSIELSNPDAIFLYNRTLNCSGAANNTDNTFKLANSFDRIIRLLSTGTSLSPILIKNDNLNTPIQLKLVKTSNTLYWNITQDPTNNLAFYLISENYSPVTFNFSVITFYVSVVFLIGRLLRGIVIGGSNNIPLTDMPNPDPLINICSGIYISRMNGDLYKEELLYYELIDILRSPEILKMVSGPSSIKKKED